MVDSVVQVDLSEQAADFRRLALQPGMGLLDKSGAHATILRKWLGAHLAVPEWDGAVVKYRIRGEDGSDVTPKSFQMLSAADGKGAFRTELEAIAHKLEAAPARTGTERALRHVMLDRLKKLQANPQQAAQSGAFGKYLDEAGVWRLVWLWGFERKSSETGTIAICKRPDCRTLAVITEEKTACPRCGSKLKVPRNPLPMLAAVLLLILVGGGAAYWFTRPPAETPAELVTINGQVFSRTGQAPVAGAKVRVGDTEVTTDDAGQFQLADLTAEQTQVVISAPGFHEEKLDIAPKELAENIWKVPLLGAGTYQGSVRDAISKEPIPQATVSLPEWGISQETDGQGNFVIAHVPAGQWNVEVAAKGYATKQLSPALAVEDEPPVEIHLAGGGKLVGTVVDAVTLKPIPDASVYLLNTPFSTKSNAQGRFEISGIPTGTATIAVQAEGYQTESSEQELQGTETRPFPVGLHGAGVIRGRVTSKATGDALPGAQVKVVHDKLQRDAETNSQGEFELLRIPPGAWDVAIHATGFDDAEAKADVEDESAAIDVALSGSAVLQGRVVDALEKTPLADVEVRIAGTELSTQTDAEGNYQLSEIPGGAATVQIVGKGYRQQQVPQQFATGDKITLDVELKGGTILSGVVQDAVSKTPIPNAEVELAGTSQKTKTDAEGRFRFEDLAAGPKTLQVAASGYQADKNDADLPADEEANVEINLKGDAVLSGTVVSALDEKPLEGAIVKIAGDVRETKTAADGTYHIENVPSGTKDLEITKAGFQTGHATRDLPAGAETQIDIALLGAAGLTGIVTNKAGRPLETAVIRIKGTDFAASPDPDGAFQLDGLLPGEVTAAISAKGFHTQEKAADLDGEKMTSLGTISLEPIEDDPLVIAKAFETPAPDGLIVSDGVGTVAPTVVIPREDFRTRLEREGARTGDVQVSLAWDNVNDIDLHVQAPSGEVIYFGNKNSDCGGELDVDMNAGWSRSEEPVENTYWPLNAAPRGKYKVLVHHFANHGGADPTEFRVAVKNDGDVKYYRGKVNPGEKVLVCEFERLTGPEPVAVTEVGPPEPMIDPMPMENPQQPAVEEQQPKKPPVYDRTEEEKAAQRLKLAEDLLDLGKDDAAKDWLEDVVNRYPNTKAAKKSQDLLDELAQNEGKEKTKTTEGIYLADLTPVSKNIGGTLQPRKVQMDSEKKHHSLWTRTNVPNPPASVEYALGRRYSRLSGAVGLDESGQADRTRVSTTFQIVGDGRVLWTSRGLRDPGQSQRFEVDVSEVNSLKILADSNRIPSHYAVWVEPWLAGSSKPRK